MDCYLDFAKIYDELICGDIDYEAIADFIGKAAAPSGEGAALMLDLACGTGTLTDILARRGYDMIGVDLSYDMLNIARKKNENILYLCQDMRTFELYGTVDAIVCMTDSLNYITDYDDLRHVFALAKNYLNPGAPFIFDINSHYKLSEVISNNTFTYDSEDVYYTWENEYDAEKCICDFYLTFFVTGDGENYRRFDERHRQRAYTCEEITEALCEAGFADICVNDGYSDKTPSEKSERLVFTAR